jgi:hypothetical protein
MLCKQSDSVFISIKHAKLLDNAAATDTGMAVSVVAR